MLREIGGRLEGVINLPLDARGSIGGGKMSRACIESLPFYLQGFPKLPQTFGNVVSHFLVTMEMADFSRQCGVLL